MLQSSAYRTNRCPRRSNSRSSSSSTRLLSSGESGPPCGVPSTPKCQTSARERWISARRRELLPTRYVHVVFTLPRELAPLALQNKKVVYDLLFRASAETLLEVAR